MTVPGRARGASTAWNRVPSGSRRSTYGRRVVETSTARGGQALGEPPDGIVVGEPDRCELEPLAAVEVHRVGSVDQNVGDAGSAQQRLERTRAQDVSGEPVVHGEDGGVADRPALVAQRGGDPGRGDLGTLAGELLADGLDHVVAGAEPRVGGSHEPPCTAQARASRAARARGERADRTGPRPRSTCSTTRRRLG